jgi:AcrR family transcriptional regulator
MARTYTSVRRRQQAADTKALVLAAATRLFSERGWAGTGMRDIADEAGVSMVPLYAHFKSKSDLLIAAIDVGVVGDTEAVPLSDRPEFAAMGVGDRTQRITAAARMLTAINQRSWGLRRALVEGAGGDEQLRRRLHQLEARRRANIQAGVELLTGEPASDDLLDAMWVVMGAEPFELLTQVGGRSVEDYERWLAGTIRALVGP